MGLWIQTIIWSLAIRAWFARNVPISPLIMRHQSQRALPVGPTAQTNHSPNSGPGVMTFPPGVYCRYITCILIQTTAQTLDWEWWFPTGSLLSLHNMHPNTNQQPKLWTGSDDIPTGSLLSLHNMHPNTNQQPKLWTGSDDIPTGSLLSLHNMHPNTNHSPNSGPGVTTFPPGIYCRYITCILIQTTAQTLDREWWYSHRESTVVT